MTPAFPPIPLLTACAPSTDRLRQRERQAAVWSVAEKVAWICSSILGGVALFTMIFCSLSLSVTLLCLALPPISVALHIKWKTHSQELSHIASIERKIFCHFSQIEEWKPEEISSFLTQYSLSPKNLPLEDLQKKFPENPLKSLLPTIARFFYWKEKFEKEREEACREIAQPYSSLPLRHITREIWYSKLEKETFPAALQAVLCLQRIEKPFDPLSLENAGQFEMRSFAERIGHRVFDGDDSYFYLTPKETQPLTTEEVLAGDFSSLRKKMFDVA